VSRAEFDRLREKLTSECNVLLEKNNQLESRINILQQENFKQNSINTELAKDIEFYKQQNLQLTESIALHLSELQKREAIILTTRQEQEMLRVQMSQLSQQSTSINILTADNPQILLL